MAVSKGGIKSIGLFNNLLLNGYQPVCQFTSPGSDVFDVHNQSFLVLFDHVLDLVVVLRLQEISFQD